MKLFMVTIIPISELFLLLCVIKSICGRMFGQENIYPEGYYDNHQTGYNVDLAISKLEHAPQLISDWPDTSSVKLGQVSAVAVDNAGRVLVFHRANNVWDASTFYIHSNIYQGIGQPPIPEPTILVFNDTGELVDTWGQNIFYIPHGITVDLEGNVWTTDVARHQVLKFNTTHQQQPELVLGEKFVPGSDNAHFCKPTAVAVLASGEFFVADGYCNHRILKFAPDGTITLQWGRSRGDSPFSFLVPHALALAEDRELVCVADREHGRVACFRTDNGTFVTSYSNWLIGSRLFSVAYSPVHGGRLYVVNGPSTVSIRVRGYVIDYTSGKLLQTFAPDNDLHNPHDIVVTPDGSQVYVAELSPYKVYKFVDESLRNESLLEKNVTVHVKPTATVEVEVRANGSSEGVGVGGGGGAWAWWGGAAGGAGGAAAAALLALAALALLRARNTGRKGVPGRRRWEYGPGRGEFKLRRLLERRRFTRVHSDDSDDEPAPMLPPPPPHPHPHQQHANA